MSIIILFCLTSPSFADDNIVVVFDTSGSMAENMRTVKQSRMKTAQDALVSVLTQVPPTTKVGIITFNGWIYDLQPVDRAKLEEAIRGTSPSGGTPLYGFIKKGNFLALSEPILWDGSQASLVSKACNPPPT
jgi:Mg-chelatase subunit ChlD